MQVAPLLLVLACDEKHPIAPPVPDPTQPTASGPREPGVSAMLSERARLFDPAVTSLVSSSIEHSQGRYRYRATSGPLPQLKRDDFIVGKADTAFVRLVLSAERVGDELIVETGHAYWHDVIKGGTYGITMPFDNSKAVTFDGQVANLVLPPVTLGSAPVSLGQLDYTFDKTDVCAWGDSLLGSKLCGKELEKEIGWLSIAGTIDTALIHGGSVKVSGSMDISMTVAPGGITGGSPPVFAPCHRGNFPGCISTPTGAVLIEWLRYYVPQIPEASLPPVRLCIPGLPVRVRAGYWDYSSFLPRWVLPTFEQCRVTTAGVLPTIVLPSFSNAAANIRPRVTGNMTIQVKGDGKIGLEIPIPSLAVGRSYTIGNDFKAEAKLGLFVGIEAQVKNAGATFLISFDQAGVASQSWTPQGGWEGGWTSTKAEKSLQFLAVDRPDSMVVRVSLPLQATAELCFAIVSCKVEEPKLMAADGQPADLFDIAINLKAGIKAYPMIDATYTREVVNEEPFVDNAKIALEGAWGLDLKAGLEIPATGWILPNVPRKWEKELECCRVPLGDLWLQGKLDVRTVTTGSAPDPDGYSIRVERADTLPRIIKAGVSRMLLPLDHGSPMTADLGATDTVVFSRGYPCAVAYTDALLAVTPVWGGIVQGLRANGVDVPSYATAYPCDLLVARYQLTLTGVSENCVVEGGTTRELWLQSKDFLLSRSDTAITTFNVACEGSSALGDMEVVISGGATPLTDRDYELALDGEPLGRMRRGQTQLFTALQAGVERTLTLTGGPTNCASIAPQTITLAAGITNTVNLGSPCVAADTPPPAPGTVTVNSVTTGAGSDPDGYQMLLDGVQRAAMPMSGSAALTGIPGATLSVLHFTNVGGNCRPSVPLPLPFTLSAGATPIVLNVPLTCVDAAADTVLGTVEAASGMFAIRHANGSLSYITGPARTDFGQLAGIAVQAWGTRVGTSLDVNGYQLQNTLADPRFTGIVVIRGTETWLFGDEAIRLLDAPASLKSAAGSFVWVGGTRDGSDVTPRIFGIIRSAP
ncbi:MAG TPA: hypothetical protein VEB19_15690 [Gemmatimonadaceae bacterium]|nr:hypothetical protein [Gemmatimonadaceae bacterium]